LELEAELDQLLCNRGVNARLRLGLPLRLAVVIRNALSLTRQQAATIEAIRRR
jgi:hypothetical protein